MAVDTLNPPPAVNDATFDDLLETCRPMADGERGTDIPWVGELWEGLGRARDLGKPLFIWAMNGHPLGLV